MTFEQLEYFVAAAEHDTFFDAANAVHISQSNLSKQIIKLEKELNISLFDRSRRSAHLTEGGRIFYKEAVALLDQYKKSLEKIGPYQQSEAATISIGTLPILAQYH